MATKVSARQAASGKVPANKGTKGKAAPKGKRTPKAATVLLTMAGLKGQTVPALLALRAATPRANLKGHYAIRRSLRAQGYYISQNR